MNILFIINQFSWGGAEKLVYDLSMNIRQSVQAVSIIALYRSNSETEQKMVADLKAAGVHVKIIGKRPGKDRLTTIKEIYSYAAREKITIIHAHCSVPMFFGKIVGFIAQIPVVCTIHNTKGYNALQERMTSWMTAKYISIGAAAESYMVDTLKINPKKIVRIYNAINVKKMESGKSDSAFWEKYGGSSESINLLNVSRVNEQKNQICLLRAINRCKQNNISVHLYVLGDYESDRQTYSKLLDFIQSNGLHNYVTFLGMHENVSDFLHNADCFVMTSWYEGLSVAFLEAVISGVPIITTDMPFVQELMGIGDCATVIQQDDDKTLCELIIAKKWKVPSEHTIQEFKNIFAMEKFVNKHLDLYKFITEQS